MHSSGRNEINRREIKYIKNPHPFVLHNLIFGKGNASTADVAFFFCLENIRSEWAFGPAFSVQAGYRFAVV